MTTPRTLKIACAGSSGGGKTTLARLLAVSLHLPVIDYSRPTAAARHLGYERASAVPPVDLFTLQWFALHEQVRSEFVIEDLHRGHVGFVADRGTLDFAAYYLFQSPGALWADPYIHIAGEHARAYDAIIHVPPNSRGTEEDGKRHLHGVQEVNQLLLDLLDRFDLTGRLITLYADTPEERLEEVLGELKKRELL